MSNQRNGTKKKIIRSNGERTPQRAVNNPPTDRNDEYPNGSLRIRSKELRIYTSDGTTQYVMNDPAMRHLAEAKTGDTPSDFDDANLSEDEEGGYRVGDIYIPPPTIPYCSTESKGPRLIISRILNCNFKSYYGETMLGPLHQSFTAIVGPNGSGKSNVIDSMLFVFGYKATKIRCKKISSLIHSSSMHPKPLYCFVRVYFNMVVDLSDDECADVVGSEFTITRQVFQDNTSQYYINERKVNFKEVVKLLKQHDVDLDHNRFLILQGEVESIAMMKAKAQNEHECGMLEYLEDIIGTSRYKQPLIRINERVDELTEERTEKHNRCKLAEREMKDLENPYNDAVAYVKLENDATRTKNLLLQKYMCEKRKKLDAYTKELAVITDDLKAHDEITEKLIKEREEKEENIQKDTTEMENRNKHKEDLQKSLAKAEKNFAEVQSIMIETNKRRKNYKTQLEKNEEEIVELRLVPNKNKTEKSDCEKKKEKLTKDIANLEVELQKNFTRVEEQTKPLIEKKDKFGKELQDIQEKMTSVKQGIIVDESELKILREEETTEARKYESLKTAFEESEKSLAEKRDRIKDLKAQLPPIDSGIKEKTAELQQNLQKEKQSEEKLRSMKSEINERQSQMQKQNSKNKTLNYLMRLKHEGIVPGILGRLGDLGAIDAEYDVAISTACGRLDFVVVETVEDAQACIEALKRDDAGRSSFIALEKIAYLANKSTPIATPERVPRLYDLVRVDDERIRPAFYFALGNTLVAENLAQGTRIAYGARRFRVVTLNGDLIETSGTMSGGGRQKISGKMGTKVQISASRNVTESSFSTQKALQDMQVEAQNLQTAINYLQQDQGRLEREIKELENKRQQSEGEIKKLAISIRGLEEQLPHIKKQLMNQKQRMDQTRADEGKVNELLAKIDEQRENLKPFEESCKKVQKKIDETNVQINKIHGDIVESVQKKIKAHQQNMKDLTKHISKLNSDATTAERNVKKMEAAIVELKANIIRSQEEIVELSEKRKTYESETEQLQEELQKATEAIEAAKTDTTGIMKEISKLRQRENELKVNRVEITERLQQKANMIGDIEQQIPNFIAQIARLKLSEIPGDTEPLLPLKTYTDEELAGHTVEDIQYTQSVQEEKLLRKPNLSALEDYIEKRKVYLEKVTVLEDITSKRNEMRTLYDDVRKKRYDEFVKGFHIITRKLKEMYQMITQGGDAELELVDSMDPFTEGVSFSVRPPKKTWKNISNLSGGEKTLSSLALVFALHYYKPSPLYFMDEIDAALDFKNISIVAHYIKERTKNAQFIIISLRSNMFELCDNLVGVYKVQDCTRTITISNFGPHNFQLFHELNHQTVKELQAAVGRLTGSQSENSDSAQAGNLLLSGNMLQAMLGMATTQGSPGVLNQQRSFNIFGSPANTTANEQNSVNGASSSGIGRRPSTNEIEKEDVEMSVSNENDINNRNTSNDSIMGTFKMPLPRTQITNTQQSDIPEPMQLHD